MHPLGRPLLLFLPLLLFFTLLPMPRPALASEVSQDAIGEVAYLTGSVIAERADGSLRALAISQPVLTGEVIVTGSRSRVEIVFNDKSIFSQGPDGRTTLDDYVYSGEPSGAKMLLKVGIGTVRYVTGEIVKDNPDGFALETPLATIGIRGTEVFAQVAPLSVRAGVLSMTPGHTVSVASSRQTRSISAPGMSVEVSRDGEVSPPAPTAPEVRERVIREAPQTTQGERPGAASITPSEIANRIKAFEEGIDRTKENLGDRPDYGALHRMSLQDRGLNQAHGDNAGRGSSTGLGSDTDPGPAPDAGQSNDTPGGHDSHGDGPYGDG
ncbi:FecR domain-containing protein [Pseudodesulfovibrio indicus]|uniref:FecR family protein n=1 Tax=Pseudodesulfovibrio indicus TaxID=1716143 RepID=UPI0029319092|nr:FecR domain-containing protein [Pseudodesulfovibrio indicus]